jgi:hypothetical protein
MVYNLWGILADQCRTMAWLAARTGMTACHIRHIKMGTRAATPEFRKRCAVALSLSQTILFSYTRPEDEIWP